MRRSASILCLAAMAATASAQSVHEQAEALFLQGQALMLQEKLAEACAAFERSHQLEPNLSTLLNHANCRERNGQLATAWRLFSDAERQTHARSDAISQQLNPIAAQRANKLESRLSKLSIDVARDHRLDGLEILLDKDLIVPGIWNYSLPIDGGTYKITVRALGYITWSTTVVVMPEGDVQAVAIPKLAPIMAGEPNSLPTQIDHGVPRPEAPPKASRAAKRSLLLPIVVGSAGLVLGGIAFAISKSGDSVYARATRERKDAKQEELWKSANQLRYTAQGIAAVAVGCAGAAIYLYVRGGRRAGKPAYGRSIRVEPTASAISMGLDLHGAW